MNDNDIEEMRLEIQALNDTLKEYSASVREWNKMYAKLVLWATAPGLWPLDEGMGQAKREVAEVLRSRFQEEKP